MIIKINIMNTIIRVCIVLYKHGSENPKFGKIAIYNLSPATLFNVFYIIKNK